MDGTSSSLVRAPCTWQKRGEAPFGDDMILTKNPGRLVRHRSVHGIPILPEADGKAAGRR